MKKLVEKVQDGQIDGVSAFHLYDTYGFPVEMTEELARERGLTVDMDGFHDCFRRHQATSQAGAEQRFKGGLADNSEQSARLHTATHLLHAALRKVLGPEVAQKGSNITAERLRFDFSFGRKMTKEELAEVERLVNEAIESHTPVTCEEMTVAQAKEQGAIGLFESKYGEKVKVYTMGPYSKEICGGPHAQNTGDLVSFKIKKEKAPPRVCGASRPLSGPRRSEKVGKLIKKWRDRPCGRSLYGLFHLIPCDDVGNIEPVRAFVAVQIIGLTGLSVDDDEFCSKGILLDPQPLDQFSSQMARKVLPCPALCSPDRQKHKLLPLFLRVNKTHVTEGDFIQRINISVCHPLFQDLHDAIKWQQRNVIYDDSHLFGSGDIRTKFTWAFDSHGYHRGWSNRASLYFALFTFHFVAKKPADNEMRYAMIGRIEVNALKAVSI